MGKTLAVVIFLRLDNLIQGMDYIYGQNICLTFYQQ
jgi:hypothetical protein